MWAIKRPAWTPRDPGRGLDPADSEERDRASPLRLDGEFRPDPGLHSIPAQLDLAVNAAARVD